MRYVDILKIVDQNIGSAFFYTPVIYEDAKSFIFKKPKEVIQIAYRDEAEEKLGKVDALIEEGLIGYTLINYEAAYILNKKLGKYDINNDEIKMSFYFFERADVEEINSKDISFEKFGELMNKTKVNNFQLDISRDEYIDSIYKIKKYIEEGDTYQVNYTVRGQFDLEGKATNLFSNLIFNQSAEYSAIINTDNSMIISVSPELFFLLEGNILKAKPMKGTEKRGLSLNEDKKLSKSLFKSDKDRAENIMIVDLLRNDLGKIAEIDSVKVDNLHKVEKYESVLQMTSGVNCKIKDKKFSHILKSLFPCGSITGAPKLRTMEIINELEKSLRGVYTGGIGIVSKEKLVLNVPIRTILIDKKSNKGKIGIGSGIVWASEPQKEFLETELKAYFLTKPTPYFELFETFLYEDGKIFLLEKHLERLKNAADYFLFKFDKEKIVCKLERELEKLDLSKEYKIRMVLDKWGGVAIESEIYEKSSLSVNIVVSDVRINKNDKFTYFKTTKHSILKEERRKNLEKGFFETIFLNENEEVTEGSITNVFIKKSNKWYTPPISSGLLNGCYREVFMKEKNAKEKILYLDDLLNADEVILTNSVRKEIEIERVLFV